VHIKLKRYISSRHAR